MPETYFSLSTADQAELLDTASAQSGRPAHLLEKDVWVVWTLASLFPLRLRTFSFGLVVVQIAEGGKGSRLGTPYVKAGFCGCSAEW